MPKLNGLEAALKISQQYAQIKVVILSTYSEGHLVQKAKQYGCKGYIVKTAETVELMDGIRRVYQGQDYFLKPVADEPSMTEDEAIVKQYKLTRRELEILELLRKEMTNKEISETLFLSVYTIETHRKNIMQKLGLKTPAALIRFFISNEGS
jgi:DNA-binding NarL/FixJ family response regulator